MEGGGKAAGGGEGIRGGKRRGEESKGRRGMRAGVGEEGRGKGDPERAAGLDPE